MVHRFAVAVAFALLAGVVIAQGTQFAAGTYAAKLGDENWALKFAADGKFQVIRLGQPVVEGTFFLSKNEITFKDEKGPFAEKGAQQVGKYRWQLQDRQLTFQKIDDKSAGRSKALTFAPWVRQ